jgi:hypothetical protein
VLDWVRLLHALVAAGVLFLTGVVAGVWWLGLVAAYAGGRVAADIDLSSRGLARGRRVPTVAEARAEARRRRAAGGAGAPAVIDLRDHVVADDGSGVALRR